VNTAQEFHFGDFTLDQSRYRLQRGERLLRLEKLPMELLILLIQRGGELVSREEIADRLWGKEVFVDIDHSINTAVRKIRFVLRDDPEKPRFVETVVGKGYRFAASVTYSNGVSSALQEAPKKEHSSPARASEIALSAAPVVHKKALPIRLMVLLGIITLAAIITIALVLSRGGAKGASQPAIKSLAVLPFENLSGDATQEYLADGMTEALIGRLAGIHNLRVISRTSAMHFKGTHLAVPEIARTLGVDAIVEGSVMRGGSRIRVHAQLIRAATDEHFWSESYDRELRDVLALQSDVAQSIAQKVEVTVSGEERARLVATRSVLPEVYENYLKGRSILDKSFNRSSVVESINYFDEATKRDPTFALAYVGEADAYNKLSTVFIGARPSEVRPKVVSAARKALELDPELAEAHVFLAEMDQARWQWNDAEAEYKRALDLKPNDAAAHLGLSHWLLCQGRMDEALTWAKRGRELDRLAVSGTSIGQSLFYSHRYEEAIRELRSVLAVQPNEASALWYLGFSLTANGQPEEAIPVLEKAVSITDRSAAVIAVLIRAYAYAGRRNDALRFLEELKRRREKGYVPAGAFVNAYLGLDDREQIFIWLERAYQEQSNILQFVKVHPYFDPVREDPRFKDLIQRVGLN